MNKYLIILSIIVCSIVLLVIVDLVCIFTINRLIIAIKKYNVYYFMIHMIVWNILYYKYNLKIAGYFALIQRKFGTSFCVN